MSQQKVDKYKEDKANRQKIMKKEKTVRRLEYTAILVVLVAVVGWVGFSVYSKAKAAVPAKQYVMDTNAIDEYIYGIDGADEELEDEVEEDIEDEVVEDEISEEDEEVAE